MFLLFITSIQCMPVKVLSKYIFKQSFEEVDFSNNIEKKEIKDFSKDFFSTYYNVEPTFSKMIFYHFENINLFESSFTYLSTHPPNT